MDDAGQRAVTALADVGGGAGDGAGGGEPAEKRRDDVGQPLAYQFLIGAVVRAGHAVGHYGGEQRFNRAEHGDGEGRQNQFGSFGCCKIGQGKMWQGARNSAVGRADGGHAFKVEQALQHGGAQQHPHWRRQAAQQRHFGHQQQQRKRKQPQCGGGGVEMRQALQQRP